MGIHHRVIVTEEVNTEVFGELTETSFFNLCLILSEKFLKQSPYILLNNTIYI